MVELAAGLSSTRLLGYRRLYSSGRKLQKLSGHERDFFNSFSRPVAQIEIRQGWRLAL
jgi:hypothetical protein